MRIMKGDVRTPLLNGAETSYKTDVEQAGDEEEPRCIAYQALDAIWELYKSQNFVIHMLIGIGLAAAAPSVGLALYPSITASFVAVAIIFLLSGMGLRTRELSKALAGIDFNCFVQCFNLLLIPGSVYLIANALFGVGVLTRTLANGVIICSTLPMTINMVIVLTKSANGDEAAAVFNSALGNTLGIFVTPSWCLLMLGKYVTINFVETMERLAVRVVAPLLIGQFIQYNVPVVADWVKRNKWTCKKIQENLLVFIVYCAFCGVFADGESVTVAAVFTMIAVQDALLVSFMCLAWISLGIFFPRQPKRRVMGLYGCIQKTIALGIPLIQAVFAGSSNLGLYLLPLLVWHPSQLIIGSSISNKLAAYVTDQEARIAAEAKYGEDDPHDDKHDVPARFVQPLTTK